MWLPFPSRCPRGCGDPSPPPFVPHRISPAIVPTCTETHPSHPPPVIPIQPTLPVGTVWEPPAHTDERVRRPPPHPPPRRGNPCGCPSPSNLTSPRHPRPPPTRSPEKTPTTHTPCFSAPTPVQPTLPVGTVREPPAHTNERVRQPPAPTGEHVRRPPPHPSPIGANPCRCPSPSNRIAPPSPPSTPLPVGASLVGTLHPSSPIAYFAP